MKKIAVIDLGTNTFHLLVVEYDDGTFNELYREKIFVRLAEEGIETIGEAPYKRAYKAIEKYSQKIKSYKNIEVKAFGTAGLRTATNGPTFIDEVKNNLDIQIEAISGDREADLISKGVGLLIKETENNQIIMDIGGGSVEFILKDGNKVKWYRSFPIGVAVLHRLFHKNDPISLHEIKQVEDHISEQISSVFQNIDLRKKFDLVGASGTFDVLETLLPKISFENYNKVTAKSFHSFYNEIIQLNRKERLAIKGMPENRVDLIIVALILINVVLNKINIEEIYISHYALKEGIISELMDKY